jgi:hypothetical protein
MARAKQFVPQGGSALHGGMKVLGWIFQCALAELLGLSLAAAWYGTVFVAFGEPLDLAPRLGVWFLLTLAAVPEAVCLGGGQVMGLQRLGVAVKPRLFLLGTLLIGLLAWGVGGAIPLFIAVGDGLPATEPSLGQTAVLASIFGAVAGLLFGSAQSAGLATELRLRWVVGNVLGWLLGLPLIYVAASLGADQSSLLGQLAYWALGGLGAGLLVGSGTAVGLMAWPSDQPGFCAV